MKTSGSIQFVNGGAKIPQELLDAQAAGTVMFFCGTGISRQDTKMPSFQELWDTVIARMEIPSWHELYAYKTAKAESNLPINLRQKSFERRFSILCRLYDRKYVLAEVCAALYTHMDDGKRVARTITPEALLAHRSILQLSQRNDCSSSIITTNYDDLFLRAAEGLELNYSRSTVAECKNGTIENYIKNKVIHLHGYFNSNQIDAEKIGEDGPKFPDYELFDDSACDASSVIPCSKIVLSAVDYGRVYIHGGGISELLREIINHEITIVFIGYSAEDRTIDYFLEALAEETSSKPKLYAFDTTTEGRNELSIQHEWSARNVIPLVNDSFFSLWDTMMEWALYASDFEAWAQYPISLASVPKGRLNTFEKNLCNSLIQHPKGPQLIAKQYPPIDPSNLVTSWEKLRRAYSDSDIESLIKSYEKRRLVTMEHLSDKTTRLILTAFFQEQYVGFQLNHGINARHIVHERFCPKPMLPDRSGSRTFAQRANWYIKRSELGERDHDEQVNVTLSLCNDEQPDLNLIAILINPTHSAYSPVLLPRLIAVMMDRDYRCEQPSPSLHPSISDNIHYFFRCSDYTINDSNYQNFGFNLPTIVKSIQETLSLREISQLFRELGHPSDRNQRANAFIFGSLLGASLNHRTIGKHYLDGFNLKNRDIINELQQGFFASSEGNLTHMPDVLFTACLEDFHRLTNDELRRFFSDTTRTHVIESGNSEKEGFYVSCFAQSLISSVALDEPRGIAAARNLLRTGTDFNVFQLIAAALSHPQKTSLLTFLAEQWPAYSVRGTKSDEILLRAISTQRILEPTACFQFNKISE